MQCNDIHTEHGQCESEHPDELWHTHRRTTESDGLSSVWHWFRDKSGEMLAYFTQSCAECHFKFTHICSDGKRFDYGEDKHRLRHDARREKVLAREQLLADLNDYEWGEWLAMWGGIGDVAAVDIADLSATCQL